MADDWSASGTAHLAAVDPGAYVEWFKRTWDPENVRDLLGLAGAVLVAYELIKKRVVKDVREFYCTGFNEKGFTHSPAYDIEVRKRHPNLYLASCDWLVEAGAITASQVEVLAELHKARGRMTHELIGFLVDPKFTIRAGLLVDAREVLKSLVIFWGRISVETSGEFDGQEVSDDDITAGDLLIFDQLLVVVARINQELGQAKS